MLLPCRTISILLRLLLLKSLVMSLFERHSPALEIADHSWVQVWGLTLLEFQFGEKKPLKIIESHNSVVMSHDGIYLFHSVWFLKETDS